MGKHVVYLRKRDENALKAAGLDPGEWVRNLVKKILEDRERTFPEVPDRKDAK